MTCQLKSSLVFVYLLFSTSLLICQTNKASYDDLMAQSRQEQNNKNYKRSSKLIQQALHTNAAKVDQCLTIEPYVQLAYNDLDLNLELKAENLLIKQLSAFDSSGCEDPIKKFRLYQAWFIVHREIDDINGSIEIVDQAHDLVINDIGAGSPQMVQVYKLYSDYYSDIGANYLAIEYAEKSMGLRRNLYARSDYNYLSGLYSLANFKERIGDYEESEKLLDTIINNIDDKNPLKSRSYHMLSLLAIRNKEYDVAKTYATKALINYTITKGPNSRDASFPLQEKGSAHLGLGEVNEAIASYQKAYDIRKNYYGPFHRLSLSSLSGLTKAKMYNGDTLAVIEDYKKVVQAFAVNYDVSNADKYVANLLKIGQFYQGSGIVDSAQVYYTQGLTLAEEYYPTGDRVRVQAHLYLASLGSIEDRAMHTKASLYHAMGDSSLMNITSDNFVFSRDKQTILEIITEHAENLYEHYLETSDTKYLNELISYSTQYDLVKNEIFNEYLTPKSIINAAPNIRRLSLLRLRSNEVLWRETGKIRYLDNALNAMNESKNSLLQVELFQKNLKTLIAIPDSIINEERTLYKQINLLKREEPKDSSSTKLVLLEQRYLDLRRSILRDNDRLSSIKDPEVVSAQSIIKELGRGELILNYFLDQGELFITYLSKERSGITKLEFGKKEVQMLSNYISTLSSGSSIDNAAEWEVGYQLTQSLIPEGALHNIDHLIILPDNQLYLLPFDALLSESVGSSQSLSDLSFFVKKYRATYLAGLGEKYQKVNKKQGETAVGYAPFMDEHIAKVTNLPQLIYSDDELSNINEVYGIEEYVGNLATKERFLKLAQSHEIIHIASHAIIDAQKPINSNIIFYPNDSLLQNRLFLWELYNMNIPTRLAVLSACQTSDGTPVNGAGLINIARGFYTAGTNSVISNLWPVQDYAASSIMKEFYRGLDNTNDPSIALHQAKLWYIDNQIGPLGHPKYWAGWVLQDSQMLSSGSSYPIYWLIALVLVLILITSVYYRRRI